MGVCAGFDRPAGGLSASASSGNTAEFSLAVESVPAAAGSVFAVFVPATVSGRSGKTGQSEDLRCPSLPLLLPQFPVAHCVW